MMGAAAENLGLAIAVAGYILAGATAVAGVALRRLPQRAVLALMVLALAAHAGTLALRWSRLGHGPFITMFEILSSNVWSLTLVFALSYWRLKPIRPVAAVVLPIILVMLAWLLVSDPGEGFFPPTYDTIWLYVHIAFGKVFLGSVIVAVGLAGVILLRAGFGRTLLLEVPDNHSLEELAYRFLVVGLVFDSLMLIAGAVWAQDAWGRYWDWDALESWSLINWLLLGLAIHARVTLRPGPVAVAAIVCLVFLSAFLTFFGVPFVSQVPHMGAV